MESINRASHEFLLSKGYHSFYKPEASSTSLWAQQDFPQQNLKSATYLTDSQPQGRGRGERKWIHGPAGTCLLATFCFRVQKTPQPITTPRVGLALFQALKKNWPLLNLQLQAPNDIFLDQKKLAGLLVEAQSGAHHFLYIGLGLNVSSSPQVDQPTTHLESKEPINMTAWNNFLMAFTRTFDAHWLSLLAEKQLSPQERKDLKSAMLHLHQDKPLNEVLPDGSLVTDGQTVLWQDL